MIHPDQDNANKALVRAFYTLPYAKGNRARLPIRTLRAVDAAVAAACERHGLTASTATQALQRLEDLSDDEAIRAGTEIAEEIRRVLREWYQVIPGEGA